MTHTGFPIKSVHAREVFDSRGNPTVEVEVRCADARAGTAIVPSGASTGWYEAVELRDGDLARLGGKGVRRAVEHVNTEIAQALAGMDAADQPAVDRRLRELDGTPNKSRLGANAILGASLAVVRAASEAAGEDFVDHLSRIWNRTPSSTGNLDSSNSPFRRAPRSLPMPMINMISGGLHAGGNLDFQDFLIVPVGATSFRQALDWTATIYHRLGRILTDRGYEGRLVGDEGGYGPRLEANSRAAELILEAIESAGFGPGCDVALAIDVASSHFYQNGRYRLRTGRDESLSAEAVIDLMEAWIDKFPIISIEDALAEDDWGGWTQLTSRLGSRVQLIGDDLFATSRERLARGIELGAANSVLIKVNQVGTLTETLQTLSLALDAGYRTIVSARSGETEDTTIADLAVATGAGQIKIGSVARSERLCKYNQLLRLEERLGAPLANPFRT